MKKSVLIRKTDYDSYGIPVPFGVLRKRQMKSFLRNELEKQHPCFSNRCCVDVKYSVKGKRIFADVVVMEKLGLAEYRKRFPGQSFVLEGNTRRKVFEKKVYLKCLAAVVLLGLCVLLIPGGKSEVSTVVKTTAPVASVMAPGKLLGTVLSGVQKAGGKVRTLKWKDCKCSFQLVNCYPENVVSGQYCSVSYADGKPEFELVMKSSMPEKRRTVLNDAQICAGDFLKSLRTEITDNGGLIQSENFREKGGEIGFKCKRNFLGKLISILADGSEKNGWGQTMFEIDCSGEWTLIKAGFSAGISLSEVKENGNPLGTVALFSDVFEEKPVKEKQNMKVISRKNNTVLSVPQREKIGEIRTDNGTVRIFYRDKDGRTVYEDKRISG